MKRWSDAQVEALIELEIARGNPDVRAVETPIIQASCICRNGCQPDAEGLVYVSPCCKVHGLRSTFGSRRGQRDARTAGSVHCGRRSNE